MVTLDRIKDMADREFELCNYFEYHLIMEYYLFRKYELECKVVNCRGPVFY